MLAAAAARNTSKTLSTNSSEVVFVSWRLHEVKLAVLEINQVAAKVSVNAVLEADGQEKWAFIVRAEVFEVGIDGSKPDSPVAAATPVSSGSQFGEKSVVDLPVCIGTPFLWTTEAQPRYVVVISVEQGCGKNQCAVQFGFDAGGKIVVTENLEKISFRETAMNPTLPSLFVVGDSTAFCNGANQRGQIPSLVQNASFQIVEALGHGLKPSFCGPSRNRVGHLPHSVCVCLLSHERPTKSTPFCKLFSPRSWGVLIALRQHEQAGAGQYENHKIIQIS